MPAAEKRLSDACNRAADREVIELERLRVLEEHMRDNHGKPPGYFTLPSMLQRDSRKEAQEIEVNINGGKSNADLGVLEKATDDKPAWYEPRIIRKTEASRFNMQGEIWEKHVAAVSLG